MNELGFLHLEKGGLPPASVLSVLLFLVILFLPAVNIARADSVIATVPVGVNPRGIAFDSANGNIYVANFGSDTVSVIAPSSSGRADYTVYIGAGMAVAVAVVAVAVVLRRK